MNHCKSYRRNQCPAPPGMRPAMAKIVAGCLIDGAAEAEVIQRVRNAALNEVECVAAVKRWRLYSDCGGVTL
jgi:hypothetical protein